MEGLTDRLKGEARRLGLDRVGVAGVRPSDHVELYREWLQEGHHGEMGYLARPDAVDRRADLKRTLEGVRSAVVVAQNYYLDDPQGVPDDPSRAVIARYARGRDYHLVIEEKLEGLLAWIRAAIDRPVEGRVYVDTGPILERELAQRAGLGWLGKNTVLIDPKRGSYLFLGILLLDLELPADADAVDDHCGTCARCIEACPTDALLGRNDDGAPVMNARRCISYLTIEHRGPIPRGLRPLIGNRVFGCDICQEVCPWNVRFAEETGEPAYAPKPEFDGPTLVDLADRLLGMGENEFVREYGDSAISRARRKGLLRNVCVGLGNWLAGADDPPDDAVAVLIRALDDDRPLVRGHAAWALGEVAANPLDRSAPDGASDRPRVSAETPASTVAAKALTARLEGEEDGWVRGEIARALPEAP